MSALLGLLALALLGAEGSSNADAPQISYETWMVEMDGLGWRETLGHDLHPVTRQGGATVWTAPEDVLKPVLEKASKKLNEKTLQVPKVTAFSQAPASLSSETRQKVATRLTRHADGPVDHASAVAYAPEYENVREGFRVTMSGRSLDQGVLTRLVVEDTRIAAVHKVMMSETVSGKGHPAANGPSKLNATIEVPELIQGSAAGEWLIPSDGLLVISLGAHTMADAEGKAAVHERVLLVRARPHIPTDPAVSRASLTPNFTFTLPPRPYAEAVSIPMPAVPMSKPPMPIPAVPSRSLPQARAADGTPIPLPPLPEEMEPPSSLPGSSAPSASPQTPHRKDGETNEEPKLDPQSKPVGYFPDEEAPKPDRRYQLTEVMEPTEAKVWRVPVGRGSMIEISVQGLIRNLGIRRTCEEPTCCDNPSSK